MRKEIKNYINIFNKTLNMSNISWWVIDYENDPEYFYCNELMEEVFDLDKTISKHSVADTCPIAGDYNKNIELATQNKHLANQIFKDYNELINQEKDEYNNTFPYYNQKTDETKYFLSRAIILEKNDENQVSILYGIIEDITDQKRAEFDLIQSQEKLQLIIDTVPALISYIDKNEHYTMANAFYKNAHGVESSKMIGKHVKEIIGEEGYKIIKPKLQKAINGETVHAEGFFHKKDGQEYWSNVMFTPHIENEEVKGVITLVIDITKSKQQENIIKEQSKMAALGDMLGNIAHQWRQPLSVISTGATGLKIEKEYDTLTDKRFFETCDAINDNAQYLSQTIDDFKNFIKGDRKQIKFNLNDNINSFLHLVEGNIKSDNIIVKSDVKDDITLYGFPNELIQCFINIFNNAKDVLKNIKNDGFIFISAKMDDDKLIIIFKDNAGGIPEDVLPKIFEPYFTTKHQSQGTGLGLSMTYNLIV